MSTLRLDGLVNARDLGGLRRVDGTRTPHGVFLRSESVDRLTPDGWASLAATGVRTIVDLRRSWERERDVTTRPDWLTTVAVDLDGAGDTDFWDDYWDNGLVGTAVYYTPHLQAMPERSVAALTAIVAAPPGPVLFHCASGRDRTGLVAMLLLVAAEVVDEAIVDDYLESVRRGDPRTEHELDELCRAHGTTTEDAFTSTLRSLDLDAVLAAGGMDPSARATLTSWRGTL